MNRETSIRKPIAKMKPIERIRVRSHAHHPATFSLVGARQIRFKSSCSSANTDVAPMTKTTMPTIVPAMLFDGSETLYVAARLEGANKHLGTLVCVSEATLAACPDIPARPIGRLRLAGKAESVMAYEPLSEADDDVEALTAYGHAFELMRSHDDKAIASFEALAETRPDDPLIRLHLARLRTGVRGVAWKCN